MKKKLLVLLLAIIAALCFAFTLSACGGCNRQSEGDSNDTIQDEVNSDNTNNDNSSDTNDDDEQESSANNGVTGGDENCAHIWGEWITSTQCGADGSYYIRYCQNCNAIYTGNWETVVHPHSFVQQQPSPATCTEDGIVAWFKCENCDYEVKKTSPSLGHVWDTDYVPDGNLHYTTCLRDGCGARNYGIHHYQNLQVVKKPTCTREGTMSGVCSDCGYHGTISIPIAHDWDEGVNNPAPTCTSAGSILYTCKKCKTTKTETVNALGHNWTDWQVTKQPNCYETGTRTHHCNRCGIDSSEELPIHHNFGDLIVVKDYTCTENGEGVRTCNDCGKTESVTLYAAHRWNNGVTITEPTCTEMGEKEFTCTVCGETYTEEIEELGHEYAVKNKVDATCTQDGYEIGTCTRCGELNYKIYSAIGHNLIYDYDDDTHWEKCINSGCDYVINTATHILECVPHTESNNYGNQTTYTYSLFAECQICDYKYKIGESVRHIHDKVEIIGGPEPTCWEGGWTYGLKCAAVGCNEILIQSRYVHSLGHTYKDGRCIRCGEGELEYTYELSHNLVGNSFDSVTGYVITDIGLFDDASFKPTSYYNDRPVIGIAENAFKGYEKLENLILPDTIFFVDMGAFEGCKNITNLTIYGTENTTNISSEAFVDCTNIQKFIGPITMVYYIPTDNLKNVVFIGDDIACFSKCTNLESITISDGANCICDNAFEGCTNLKNITIPDSVTTIGDYAFSGCTSLESITIGNGVTSIGDRAFYSCTSLESVNFGNNSKLTSIGDSAFEYCTSLESIDIPNSVTSIGHLVFCSCIRLESITIPDSVTSICWDAFSETPYYSNSDRDNWRNGARYIGKNLVSASSYNPSIEIEEGTKTIGYGAFWTMIMSIESIKIPNSVTTIGDYAFEGCTKLADITIGDGVTSIGDGAFYNTNYYNDDDNWRDGVLYIGKYLIKAKKDITSCTIEAGTKLIADNAFEGCANLTSINIPASVTYIGDSAFKDCKNLESILIPDGVSSIGDSTFWGCESLESINIPADVTSIGDSAFYNCNNLNGVYITDLKAWCNIEFGSSDANPLYYADNLYLNNNLVTEITADMLQGITEIKDYTFNGCTSIKSIDIPDNVTSIGSSAFECCDSLQSLTIGDSVTSIGKYAFYLCEALKSIEIPASVSYIDYGAFAFCFLGDVTFENQTGWKVSRHSSMAYAHDVDVSDTYTNASYLGSYFKYYYTYYWQRYDVE